MLYPVELQAQIPAFEPLHPGAVQNLPDWLPGTMRPDRVTAPGAVNTPAQLVGVAGFEPATYCSQSSCATRLRYTPASRQVSPILQVQVKFLLIRQQNPYRIS